MANSVSLSSNMKMLYFTTIDGTTPIPLNENGALIYLKDGELTAEIAPGPLNGVPIVESTVNAQWTITYNEETQMAFFIGITELDTSKEGKKHDLPLIGKQINIKENGNGITIISE